MKTPKNPLSLEQLSRESETYLLVAFCAPWSAASQKMALDLTEIAQPWAESLQVLPVDIDQNQLTALAYRISTVPTMLVFQAGSLVERVTGVTQRRVLETIVKRLMAETVLV